MAGRASAQDLIRRRRDAARGAAASTTAKPPPSKKAPPSKTREKESAGARTRPRRTTPSRARRPSDARRRADLETLVTVDIPVPIEALHRAQPTMRAEFTGRQGGASDRGGGRFLLGIYIAAIDQLARGAIDTSGLAAGKEDLAAKRILAGLSEQLLGDKKAWVPDQREPTTRRQRAQLRIPAAVNSEAIRLMHPASTGHKGPKDRGGAKLLLGAYVEACDRLFAARGPDTQGFWRGQERHSTDSLVEQIRELYETRG